MQRHRHSRARSLLNIPRLFAKMPRVETIQPVHNKQFIRIAYNITTGLARATGRPYGAMWRNLFPPQQSWYVRVKILRNSRPTHRQVPFHFLAARSRVLRTTDSASATGGHRQHGDTPFSSWNWTRTNHCQHCAQQHQTSLHVSLLVKLPALVPADVPAGRSWPSVLRV